MDSWEKELLTHNIVKSLNVTLNSGELNEIVKACSIKDGNYADTAMNREKGIVGMPYKGMDEYEKAEEETDDEEKKEEKED